jgi:hypothetical protein
MSSYASDFSSAGPQRDYVSNVSITARAFFKALFAVNAAPSHQPDLRSIAPVSAQKRASNLKQLHEMANECESLMPGMASELRCIAARG